MPEVNLLAVLLAGVLAFVLGGIWYGPLFGAAWMGQQGLTEEELRRDFSPTRTFGASLVMALISAYVLEILLWAIDAGMPWEHGAAWGMALGAGLATTSIGINYQFERSSYTLLMINGGYHTVRYALMGALLAAM